LQITVITQISAAFGEFNKRCGAYSRNYRNWQLESLLHLGQIVITFRTLLHLGQNIITFRTLLQLGPFITFRPSTIYIFFYVNKVVMRGGPVEWYDSYKS